VYTWSWIDIVSNCSVSPALERLGAVDWAVEFVLDRDREFDGELGLDCCGDDVDSEIVSGLDTVGLCFDDALGL
jgi:hypothetical protein